MEYIFNGVCLQNGRQSNMDSLLLKRGSINELPALLAVVCDGVGSLVDGMFASATAARMLGEWFSEADSAERIGLRMRDAVLKINSHILSESKKNNLRTASTLSALLLVEGGYFAVHIGDSRIYCYDSNNLTILTKDDISETGKLTACIGQEENIYLQYYEGTAAGNVFLICSDGLYKRMDDGFLAASMASWGRRSLAEPIDALAQYAIGRGELDNISVAMAKIDG